MIENRAHICELFIDMGELRSVNDRLTELKKLGAPANLVERLQRRMAEARSRLADRSDRRWNSGGLIDLYRAMCQRGFSTCPKPPRKSAWGSPFPLPREMPANPPLTNQKKRDAACGMGSARTWAGALEKTGTFCLMMVWTL